MGALFGGLLPLVVLGGIVFAIVSGFRSASTSADPIDPAEAAKSFVLHVALFVALIATGTGLIDLVQSAIGESERLAGANSDLARGLALVIVAAPSYTLLLRAIVRRAADRSAAGDARPTRGWSVYLVAALTTTLVATLVSVGQVAYDATGSNRSVDRSEVAQLLVWLVLWLAHWFVLRPQLRLRGDAHLAIGSVLGLGWLLSGAGALSFRVLESGYGSIVDRPLGSSVNLTLWSIVAGTGAVVWVWHWWTVFDAPSPGSPVEGVRRASPLWYLTVVVAGILPGLIAMLVAGVSLLSLLGIWFFGTTDESASDYFRPAPDFVAILLLGVVTWAYHRRVLERPALPDVPGAPDATEEVPIGSVRNESIRFHDYVVVAVGLVAVVGATASLVGLMLDTLAGRSTLAGEMGVDNTAIVTLIVLGAGALVWWRQWGHIEHEHEAHPIEESDSFWRKLYLIAGFGLGGSIFGVSLVWVLFVFLRDLLDTGLGRGTIRDLADPIGWATAVAGVVWYHFGVWQADRTVLEARLPPPPMAADAVSPRRSWKPTAVGARRDVGMALRPANPDDTGELYTLQLADRASRPETFATSARAPESLAEMEARMAASDTTVIVDGHRIVGFVSRPLDATPGTGVQVVVAPDRNTAEIMGLLPSTPSPGDRTS